MGEEERGERGGGGDLWGNCRKCRECNPLGGGGSKAGMERGVCVRECGRR